MKVPSAVIVGESRVKCNLRNGLVAFGAVQPHLRNKAVRGRFRDRAVAQDAEDVQKADNRGGPSRPIHQACEAPGRRSAQPRSTSQVQANPTGIKAQWSDSLARIFLGSDRRVDSCRLSQGPIPPDFRFKLSQDRKYAIMHPVERGI